MKPRILDSDAYIVWRIERVVYEYNNKRSSFSKPLEVFSHPNIMPEVLITDGVKVLGEIDIRRVPDDESLGNMLDFLNKLTREVSDDDKNRRYSSSTD